MSSTSVNLVAAATLRSAEAASMPAGDVPALVRAAQRGDRAAFAELYARYAALVHGILLSRVDRGDVQDLVQDVFIRAMTALPSLREPEAFGGWLSVLARNRATDFRRRRVPTVDLDDRAVEHVADRRPSPAVQMDAAAVLDVIRSLPDAYRETLVLRLVEGMTGPEIATLTGLTPGSVRVNLHRGMKLLRERLEGTRGECLP
jgi:RNA polymerase sigma-70 factor (ECF subfamily)